MTTPTTDPGKEFPMTTETLFITPQIRFAAQDAKRAMRAADRWDLASIVDTAAVAESFDHSVTVEAVRVARRVLVAAAEDRWGTVRQLGLQVATMRASGEWFV